MKLVFAGTPDAAVPSLQALLNSDHDVVAVITRPDARKGRGRSLSRSPVGELATEVGIPLLQPTHPREPEFQAALAEIAPDCVPVVAYGALVPQPVLDIPKHGWVNLHFSLLPAWRGAAPVQRAIAAGDDITGASTFQLEAGMDTGPVFGIVTEAIGAQDTAGDLLDRLAHSGAHLLRGTMDAIATGEAIAVPQSSDGVSLAPKLHPEDAQVDWHTPAMHIDRLIRACTPAPGAWTIFDGQRLKLGPATIAAEQLSLTPGQLEVRKQEVLVGTLSGVLKLGHIQPMGKKPMPAADWVRGARVVSGAELA